MNYLHRLLIAINQLANTILNGYPDETLSSRAYRRYLNGHKLLAWFINALFINRNHCREAYESELNKTQYPEHFRQL